MSSMGHKLFCLFVGCVMSGFVGMMLALSYAIGSLAVDAFKEAFK